jgi:hypothetical protein
MERWGGAELNRAKEILAWELTISSQQGRAIKPGRRRGRLLAGGADTCRRPSCA